MADRANAAKAVNAADETATRKQLKDKALEAAGWSPVVRYAPGATYDSAAVEVYEPFRAQPNPAVGVLVMGEGNAAKARRHELLE